MNSKNILLGVSIGANVGFAITVANMRKEIAWRKKRYNKLWETSSYLVSILEKSEVSLDDFDMIAFRDIWGPSFGRKA